MRTLFNDGLPFRLSRGIVVLFILQLLGNLAQAQIGSLSLSLGSGDTEAGIALNLSLTSGSTALASVQWTLTYAPASITAISARPGVASISASKSITCASGSGSYTCLVTGLNATAIPNGTVAIVNVTLSTTATGIVPIGVTNTLGASPSGTAVTLNGTTGSDVVDLNQKAALSAVTCNPTTLSSANSSTCTVALTQAAPAGGAAISLSSNNALLSLPPSVKVSAGAINATFNATAGSISSKQAAVVTATLNGNSVPVTLSLLSTIPAPTLSGTLSNVLDAASYTPNIAPGCVFVVKGSNLSPNNGLVQAPAYPLPTTLNGVSISLIPVNGTGTAAAYMVYTFNDGKSSQLAAILPSTVATGIYNVVVTISGVTVGTYQTTVVGRKFGLTTADSTGTGMVLAQNVVSQAQYDVNRFTTGSVDGSTYSPANPGEAVIAWGTGLGAISGSDNVAPGNIDFSNQVTVRAIVGNKTITPFYAGRAPTLAGADQVNFFLPPDVDTGCAVPFQISIDGQLSNPTTIAIAPPGHNACISPQFSSDILSRLDQGGSLTVGTFEISEFNTTNVPGSNTVTSKVESANGFFARYSGDQLSTAVQFLNPTDACEIFVRKGDQARLLYGDSATDLDAGAITLTGPSLNGQLTQDFATNAYSLVIGTNGDSTLTSLRPTTSVTGTYQIQGAGGADIGPFTATLNVGQTLTLTSGIPAAIDRTNDLTVSWSGGNPTDLVVIAGISGTAIGVTNSTPTYDARVLVCSTTAGKGSFTIPARMLSQLPATPTSGAGLGYMQVSASTQPAAGDGLFPAPLTAGGAIDTGAFLGMVGVSSDTIYQ